MGVFDDIKDGVKKAAESGALGILPRKLVGESSSSAKTVSEEEEARRIEAAGQQARENLVKDMELGKQLGQDILGDGLGRLSENDAIKSSQSLLRKQAGGLTDAEKAAQRESASRQLQGSQQAASRSLSASLARSGVKGGAAGQQQVELAAQGLQARRDLERDLFLSQSQAEREGAVNLANFETRIAEFDIAQIAKEKNIITQAQLSSAELGTSERNAVRQAIAAENIAEKKKEGESSGGTVLCSAMYYNKLISSREWAADKAAGISLVKNRETRKAFLLYNKVCKPFAVYCMNNRWAAIAISPFIVPISKHFVDRNILGTILFKIAKFGFMSAVKIKSWLK